MRIETPIQRIDMRGVMALDEAGDLGLITTPTKVSGTYRGVTLEGSPWACAAPTRTAGHVRGWLRSGLSLQRYLDLKGMYTHPTLPKQADEWMTLQARKVMNDQ